MTSPEPAEDVDLRSYWPERGLPCPECECRMSDVYRTTRLHTIVLRVRICRHCGARFETTETVASNDS